MSVRKIMKYLTIVSCLTFIACGSESPVFESVEQKLGILGNQSFQRMDGLEQLSLVGQNLWVSMHPLLPSCEADKLPARIGEANIGGQIILEGNQGEGDCS